MNIGIDIDGVLTNLERYMLDYGTKYCIEENLPIDINANEYWIVKVFNWPEELDEKFWNKYLMKYVEESNPREFAPEIIKKLQEKRKSYIYNNSKRRKWNATTTLWKNARYN